MIRTWREGFGAVIATVLLGSALMGMGDDEAVKVPGKIHEILPMDAIAAIKKPTYVSAEKAKMPDDARVIAVKIGDEARVYDPNILNHHEIVNDELEGKKIAVTW